MSIKAFPLNQTEYSYNAQDVMKYYAGRNSGVFETGDNLKVSANGGLELRINTGMGWLAKDYVASVAFWNESVEYLMVEAGHDTYGRIDLVVVSWNFIQQEQNPTLIIRKGTPSSSPTVPALVNDSSTIEIALARINVAKGAITLTDRNIVDLRGNDTYCPMVYDEQTIRNAFMNCVGYADGVKKISDFPSVTPTASDKLLIENGGTGKSTTIVNAVNTCSLTYEEIMATTNLSGKVASASALKDIVSRGRYHNAGQSLNVVINRPCLVAIRGDGNSDYYIGMIARPGYSNIVTIVSSNTYDSKLSYDKSTGTLSLPTVGWYEYLVV